MKDRCGYTCGLSGPVILDSCSSCSCSCCWCVVAVVVVVVVVVLVLVLVFVLVVVVVVVVVVVFVAAAYVVVVVLLLLWPSSSSHLNARSTTTGKNIAWNQDAAVFAPFGLFCWRSGKELMWFGFLLEDLERKHVFYELRRIKNTFERSNRSQVFRFSKYWMEHGQTPSGPTVIPWGPDVLFGAQIVRTYDPRANIPTSGQPEVWRQRSHTETKERWRAKEWFANFAKGFQFAPTSIVATGIN